MALQLTAAVFKTIEDIGNRVMDHIGQSHMLTIDDDDKGARLVKFNYPLSRQAELRRNVWRFSIKRAALRPLEVGPLVDNPTKHLDPDVYDSSITYFQGEIVEYAEALWIAMIDTTGDTPGTANSAWSNFFGSLCVNFFDAKEGYYVGEFVYTDVGDVYSSLTQGNTEVPGTGNQWVAQVNAAMQDIAFFYPIGTGPTIQSATRNIFELPYGFLRQAPQDPKAGSVSVLGGPSGLAYDDWEFESNNIVSRDAHPIVLRFAADVTDIPAMDTMFCEGLSARIAMDVCEPVTQSTERLRNIAGAYGKHMSEARMVNGIETGPTEPPEDDFIQCRK